MRTLRSAWPPWPQFTPTKAELNPSHTTYKSEIASQHTAAALRKGWLSVCKSLEDVTAEIAQSGTDIIPILTKDEFLVADEEERERIRRVGCFVVRGVVKKEEAEEWYQGLKRFVRENEGEITGWPQKTPIILDVFNSPSQVAARSHPNILRVAGAVNSLWHDRTGVTSPEQLSYSDGVRIRKPGTKVNICPHIDAGSLARWADPAYRSVYKEIWEGNPENHDPYDLDARKDARPQYFPGEAHSSVLRTFQGWTALSEAGPGDGSLMVYPNVKAAIAYILLRPFFDPPKDKHEILDASKWAFNMDSCLYPGTWADNSQLISPESHPHLKMEECLVSIPRMEPGDTIWWHADMCHVVEIDHAGQNDAAVIYIGATPTTPKNVIYVKNQWERFQRGAPPEDFEHGKNETLFRGFKGVDAILSGEMGRRAAGGI